MLRIQLDRRPFEQLFNAYGPQLPGAELAIDPTDDGRHYLHFKVELQRFFGDLLLAYQRQLLNADNQLADPIGLDIKFIQGFFYWQDGDALKALIGF